MAGKTHIEWTQRPGFIGAVWNIVRGCSLVSPGCSNCYAEPRAYRVLAQHKGLVKLGRLKRAPAYEGTVELSKSGRPRWTGKIQLAPHLLDQPLRWRKPRLIFVNSMSDLFHPGVPFEYIAASFGVMAAADRHDFQILTKRPERTLEFFEWLMAENRDTYGLLQHFAAKAGVGREKLWVEFARLAARTPRNPWPLPNVWLGVSVEDQASVDKRVKTLRRCPAAIHFISQEPQLGPIEYRTDTFEWQPSGPDYDGECELIPPIRWVIIGGESGRHARPFDLAWARKTIAQCREAKTAVFMKQFGPVVKDSAQGIEYRRAWWGKKGNRFKEFPPDLRVQEWPETA